MIIDCHGHYTTAPHTPWDWREKQKSLLDDPVALAALEGPDIYDAAIAETIESSQLKLQRERGADLTIFSPRASAMAHHIGDEAVSVKWTRICNDIIHRVVRLMTMQIQGDRDDGDMGGDQQITQQDPPRAVNNTG